MVKIAAYYYPGWHKEGSNSEWNVVKNAKSYFDGHYQPRVPMLGHLDDSKVPTLEKQTKLAKDFYIDSFIFDWYWKKGKTYSEDSIKAFTRLDTDMEFSLMWSWKLPRTKFPIAQSEVSNDDDRWVETSKGDFLNLLDYCSEHYFNKKNYQKVDGKPYFVMYFADGFLNKLGLRNLTEMLSAGDTFLKRNGHKGLYSVGVVTDSPLGHFDNVSLYRNVGFKALTGYNFLADFGKDRLLLQDYATLASRRKSEWKSIHASSKLPYIPSISLGWDATPRGVKVDSLSQDMSFPWAPVVVNATPENFAKNLQYGMDFIGKTGQDTLHICSWNEWSEGAHLEPDDKYGYQFLEKVRDIKSK